VASDHAGQNLPETTYTRAALEADDSDASPATKVLPADDHAVADRPVNETSHRGSSDDGSDANASLAQAIDRAPEPANDHAADAAIEHAVTPALFGGAGAEGVMHALMAMAPAESPAAKIGGDPASLQHAMSDFAGAKLIDTIVDHFTDGSGPAIALAANDAASQILVQLVDGGIQGAFHDQMIAMADADAHALAAAQA